jgi:hypothetical protein
MFKKGMIIASFPCKGIHGLGSGFLCYARGRLVRTSCGANEVIFEALFLEEKLVAF